MNCSRLAFLSGVSARAAPWANPTMSALTGQLQYRQLGKKQRRAFDAHYCLDARLLSGDWNPRLFPCRGVQRFAMTLNSGFNIAGKVGVDGGFGILAQQSNAFRDLPARRRNGLNHCHGL